MIICKGGSRTAPTRICKDEAKNLENIRIGFLGNGVAVVVWTERRNDVIRIISARRANRYERQKLEQYLSD